MLVEATGGPSPSKLRRLRPYVGVVGGVYRLDDCFVEPRALEMTAI
jgi:hypothetical protein